MVVNGRKAYPRRLGEIAKTHAIQAGIGKQHLGRIQNPWFRLAVGQSFGLVVSLNRRHGVFIDRDPVVPRHGNSVNAAGQRTASYLTIRTNVRYIFDL